MGLFGFLKSKVFFRHTLIAILITIILMWVTLRLLSIYTRHGSYITVADFKGIPIAQINSFAANHDMEAVIIDSLYDYALQKGTVAMQDPAPGTKVKKNRKIYLTVVANKPEQISMPNLVDLTLRQAIAMLETYGLKTGTFTYVPDIAHNAILRQKYKGKDIKIGTLIEKGSKIDLVIGKGDESSSTTVPDLFGKKQSQANAILESGSLNVGNEIFLDGNDTVHARVYKQKPEANSSVQYGGTIDLWYRSDKKYDFKKK
jgi:eukaryotic-like serine/threonine-protein kinase